MKIINILKNLFILVCFIAFISLISSKTTLAVDSNGHWEKVGSLNNARVESGFALLKDGRVIVAGGIANLKVLGSSEIYDPINKTWETSSNLNVPRSPIIEPGMVTLSTGEVVITNGHGPNSFFPTPSTEIYNPNSKIWTKVADSKIGRYRAIVALLPNNKVLLASGNYNLTGGGITNTAEIYDPEDDSWSFTSSMYRGRDEEPSTTTLPDGKIIIAGGKTYAMDNDNTAEIYDPNTNKWLLSTIPFGMNRGKLTLLKNGTVLATAGNSAAIYYPKTNSWEIKNGPSLQRLNHGTALLSDGNVLIFGGNIYNTNLNSPEIYSPSSNSWVVGPPLPIALVEPIVVKLPNDDYLITAGGSNQQESANTYIFTNGNDDTNQELDVPYFNQSNPIWGSDEYDFASRWSPNDTSISSWGCALTSTAMILKYHGYDKLPNGSKLNPGSLNSWLKNQNDGFIRNGLVNWEAIKRLSRQAKEVNGLDFSALEFEWIHFKDDELLKENIQNNLPTILEVGSNLNSSHFIVASGVTESSFNIKDPAYISNTLLSDYNNSYKSMRVFSPSRTDLSSIQIVINDEINISSESNTSIINNGFQAKLYPIENDQNSGKSGDTLNSYYISKPESGNYTFSISSDKNQKYQIDIYLYDEDSNLKTKTFKGVLTKNSNDEFSVYFDKLNSEKSKIDRKRALGLDLFF